MNGNEIRKNSLPGPAEIICPECKKSIKVSTHFLAINVVCKDCSSIIDNRSKGVLRKFRKKVTPLIPIGTKGTLKNTFYEAVGYIHYREYKTIYTWHEYTLFNPLHGYAYLTEYDGHWSFNQRSYIYPLSSLRSFEFLQQTFNQFNDYKASVDYAEGEFNWNILQAEKVDVTEFIAPPYMLIKEKSAKELIWYRGEYIDAHEVKESFKIQDKVLPKQSGVGVLQPSKINNTYLLLRNFTIAAALVLCLLQMFLVFSAKEKVVFDNTYTIDTARTYVTPPFKLENSYIGKDNVDFELFAPVDNDWFEASITMVNEETGEEYFFEQGVEYYRGSDWSEGETVSSKVLSSVPDGTYHLNITPFFDPISFHYNKIPYFEIKVIRGSTNWLNFFIVLVCILIYPIIQRQRNGYFEYQRWQSSKYSD